MSKQKGTPLRSGVGGEGGIRTPVTLSSKAVFKTAAFNRSATSPQFHKANSVCGALPNAIYDQRQTGKAARKYIRAGQHAIFAQMATLRVEFLGTGTSQGVPVVACECAVCRSADPRDKRLRTSVWVQVNGKSLLIDAGPDLRQQLLRSRVERLDAVLLTHEHMDHIAGIDELRAFNFKQDREMDMYGNAATNAAVKRMFHYAFAEQKYPGVPELELHTLGNSAFDAQGVEVLPVQVMHHEMPVLGFRIGGFAYITDAKTISSAEKEKLKGLEVLVLNALRKKTHLSHLNLSEAMDLVQELGPKKAYFTHISHLLGDHAAVSQELPPTMQLAYDGLVVTIPHA